MNRSDDDLVAIASALALFSQPSGEALFSWDADQQFHIAIANATQNFLRTHVLTNIFSLSQEFLQPVLLEAFKHSDNRAVILGHHAAIYRAIEQQNADVARGCMDEHLCWTNEHLVEWLDAK